MDDSGDESDERDSESDSDDEACRAGELLSGKVRLTSSVCRPGVVSASVPGDSIALGAVADQPWQARAATGV